MDDNNLNFLENDEQQITSRLTITEINALTNDEFISFFCDVIDKSSDVLNLVIKARPFFRIENLKEAFTDSIDWLHGFDKIKVVNRYNKRMKERLNTFEPSAEEIQSVHLEPPETNREVMVRVKLWQKFRYLWSIYKHKFEFPFLFVFEDHQTLFSIIGELERRVRRSYMEELQDACQVIYKIIYKRIDKLVIET